MASTPAASAPQAPSSARAHEPWRDPALPAADRAHDLAARMTLEEKLGQLVGIWVGATVDGRGVAPHQDDLAGETLDWDEAIRHGLGQLTRVFGTHAVEPLAGARALAASQEAVRAASRFGIPAMAHEECLAGFAAHRAAVFPVPLSWGATFDPDLVREMAAVIGADLRAAGVHQGLAPVLDVVRDLRWGRVEETIGEDPYLIGELAAAYVAGIESQGVVATLKHFAGYSASRAGRNLAPVSMGPREFADVLLPPFETALRKGGARSVMHAYTDIDGTPSAADEHLLTTVLREEWGFTGTVVADYFGVSFLHLLHHVAEGPGDAAAQALTAGVDVELPSGRCYTEPLAAEVRAGRVPEALVDRALLRVLTQKAELGLLDPDWRPNAPEHLDLDTDHHRDLARRLAREAIVLLANDSGVLPLDASRPRRLAVVGPVADDPISLFGCYSFPAHVGGLGVEAPTVVDALREALPGWSVEYVAGCDVREPGTDGIPDAVRAAREADLVLAVVGDRPGMFGRGTSGEGCDAPDLSLPGEQGALLDAVLDAGTPTVLTVLSGRPYAVGGYVERAGAVVQAFFPGEEGGRALADLLTGAAEPAGRLPVSVPRDPGGQPGTYLTAPLGRASSVSALDPTPLYPFGHGLAYTTYAYEDLALSRPEIETDEEVEIACTVRNTGERAGRETVQLYVSDPVAQVVRPERQLAGFARIALAAGEARRVTFRLHAERTSFTGRNGQRVVEPGEFRVLVGRSSADTPLTGSFTVSGEKPRPVGHDRVLDTPVTVTQA
ncbi:beta-xylosidase/alpha-l-arabinosidase [Streptomyces endophyticus]|uniref:Glycoside hydrolase family 3 C-terminal domain-containing protein n=1 Tax=Streptomyces endophyticus TaxID=714166 RepID=A0ABU6F2K9_9ACTN|nr:glycoside hydrolase family 3 N-terminal domain-containing protein [Streptomyces endophyticus]MEB8338223.1 glycoside hydrolase family 3 C-terminal domain-containing protein [Streptomyces endophyticus]